VTERTDELDNAVRVHLYRAFVDAGTPPSVSATAEALARSEEETADAYRRLEQRRVIVLAPGTLNVWMANPLSAVPTEFAVDIDGRSYWGNCIWDGLGVVSMLGGRGRVTTACADCGEPMVLAVDDYELRPVDGVAHFAVPAARWWENIGFT
jgi:hypothetical protein